MAIKKCKECGNDISTKAASCPKCGAVLKQKTGCFTYLVFIGLVFTLFVYGARLFDIKPSSSIPAEPSNWRAAVRKDSMTEILKNRNRVTDCWKYMGIAQSCASQMPNKFPVSLTEKIRNICQSVQNEEVKQSSEDAVKMWMIIWEGTRETASKKTISIEDCNKYQKVFSEMVN